MKRARKKHGPGLTVALIAVMLLGAGALVLLASPRHRAFYFGLPGSAVTALTGPSSFAMPRSPFTRTVSPAPVPPRVTAALTSGARIPAPDDQGRVLVPVADHVPARLPAAGVPTGWTLREFSGDASVELVRSEGEVALRLRSEHNSFALHRDLVLDVRQYPLLSWTWKVVRLPQAGDVREAGRDDQAAQVYVIFPRWPAPQTTSDVVGYVWDSRAPAGTTLQHPRAPNVRIIVLQSGPARADTWIREHRNVAEDYRALFGKQPSRVGKVALMIDTNDTRGEAEALFGDLTFSRRGASQHTEIPIAVLR